MKKLPSPIILDIIGVFLFVYLWLCQKVIRWRIIGKEYHRELIEGGKPFIIVTWHGRLIMVPCLTFEHDLPAVALGSRSKDASAAFRVLRWFKLGAVRGSTHNENKPDKQKGGNEAIQALIEAAEAGNIVGITPDGPRGPRYQARRGAAALAHATGLPILPICYSTRSSIEFNSWDRFLLPLPIPFRRGVTAFGKPIHVAAPGLDDHAEIEAGRQEMEASLNALLAEADKASGLADRAR